MLEQLKHNVCDANLELARKGLVTLTWGNVSGCDRKTRAMVIKPSGVSYESLCPEQMVVVSLETGECLEGELDPSSDTPTHLELYRAFQHVDGVVHTHSPAATAFAQACRELPCLGTTHADHFAGTIPLAPSLTPDEVRDDYEGKTGASIVATFHARGLDPLALPAVFCAHHGPFTWGRSAHAAVQNAIALEHIAQMALQTWSLEPHQGPIPHHIRDKHFTRKHGSKATYGERSEKK